MPCPPSPLGTLVTSQEEVRSTVWPGIGLIFALFCLFNVVFRFAERFDYQTRDMGVPGT